ncbi:phospholipase A2 inhibitor and Ly6/PLAUR domain-containing protein-like [Gouania willdenowi]|uniref:phospholipase A2 inhibitor and Ly6/PLAUR domain-containing protein-like n=1 Tax=Gouania willdenowi TaxID=441366 RepID=UPI0010569EAA|nr:phospholipase A2 inhibitor and Ly6/PLAUR domain-containing protein-like [Gouania willdenowi]
MLIWISITPEESWYFEVVLIKMKLILFVLLLTLCSTAAAIDCHCQSAECAGQPSCSSSDMCFSATTEGGTIYKGCAKPSLCPAVGTQIYSADDGKHFETVTVMCCDTDNCNSADLASPYNPRVDTLIDCDFCIADTCNFTVHCKGMQNTCYQMIADGSKHMGCSTTNMCDAPEVYTNLLFPNITMITEGPECCLSFPCPTTTTPPITEWTTTSQWSAAENYTTEKSISHEDLLIIIHEQLHLIQAQSFQLQMLLQPLLLLIQHLLHVIGCLPLAEQMLFQPIMSIIQYLLYMIQMSCTGQLVLF